ncbi:NADP-dependent oxidoreductase [Nocardia sp. CA-107356]|uniref:NADP-dependent oxidoreductase n=1 Tax=Nocardia sp. CA-107356 TaxID=3239972 RepID=UPI003D930C00
MTHAATEIRLAARPGALPTLDDFEVAQVDVTAPAPGQVLVRNLFTSLDPGMLTRMRGEYVPGKVMTGDAVGEVVASADPSLREGDLVRHLLGWRDYALADASRFMPVPRDIYPSASYYLGFGLNAYAGLTAIAELRAGDTVFVSSAAGATGGLAGQIARLMGAGRVIGSAGSPEKVVHLTDRLGFDSGFDYRHGSIADHLRTAAPDGVDVFFDNVGGAQLRAAIEVMNPFGRIAMHGFLAHDGDLGDLRTVIGRRLTLRGFTVTDHMGLIAEFGPRLRTWLDNGQIVYDETVIDGLSNAPQALLDLLAGRFTGKVVVSIG